MPWELNSDRPLYTQLVEQVELRILTGIYPPGTRLPSVRELAQDAAVNPNTMQRALVQLEEAGLVTSHRTSGRFVTDDTDRIAQARHHLARDQIEHFLDSMRKLGYQPSDALGLLTGMIKETQP